MSAELLPCPFCGGTPTEAERADLHTSTGHIYFIACMCGGYSATAHQFGETRAEAIAAWNRRAPVTDDQPTELSTRIRKYAEQSWKFHTANIKPSELIALSDEIDRYYTGMMAWKKTAEAKDAQFAAGPSEAQVMAAARVLSDSHADDHSYDREREWDCDGATHIIDARAALKAAWEAK
jgi:Lar family restriction alleviation protein